MKLNKKNTAKLLTLSLSLLMPASLMAQPLIQPTQGGVFVYCAPMNPNLECPDFDFPHLDFPNFELPDFEFPNLTWPDVDFPEIAPPTTPETEKPEITPPTTPETEKPEITPPTTNPNASMEQQVLDLVNQERTSRGLSALKADTAVQNVAYLKSKDMQQNNYFSHTSPTYGSPFDMLKQFNISYSAAGENIAMGYTTAEAVVDGWMNSPGHKANNLNPTYTHLGVGYYATGSYWTQLFIAK